MCSNLEMELYCKRVYRFSSLTQIGISLWRHKILQGKLNVCYKSMMLHDALDF